MRYRLGDQEWSIEQVGDRVVTVDPDGTRAEELVGKLASARVRVLINQRLRAGWKLVSTASPTSAQPRTPVVENARNPELEAALLADPENVAAWLVYGDWLQQQGDPRGTHIAFRDAVRTTNDPLALDRLRKYEALFTRYLTGGYDGVLGWGFLDLLRTASVDGLGAFAHPLGRFITRLEIARPSLRNLNEILAALGRHDPPTLRALSIATDAVLGELAPIDSVLSRLRILDLDCHASRSCLAHLASAPLSKLRFLRLCNEERRNAEAIETLLRRPGLDSLVELHLDDRSEVNLSDLLPRSAIAAQLERLVVFDPDEDQFERLAERIFEGKLPKLTHLEVALEVLEALPSVAAELERQVATVCALRRRYVPIPE